MANNQWRVADMTNVPDRPALTEAEARSLTEHIRATASNLWDLMTQAYEQEAWSVLGYDSFAAYAHAEFDMSKVNAYRLVAQGQVLLAIEEASGVPRAVLAEELSARAASDVKPALAEVTDRIGERVEREPETPPATIVQEEVAAQRTRQTMSKQSRPTALIPEPVAQPQQLSFDFLVPVWQSVVEAANEDGVDPEAWLLEAVQTALAARQRRRGPVSPWAAKAPVGRQGARSRVPSGEGAGVDVGAITGERRVGYLANGEKCRHPVNRRIRGTTMCGACDDEKAFK